MDPTDLVKGKKSLISRLASSWLFYIYLFVFILLIMNYRQVRVTNFDCEICADKAGYYVYLPAVFYLGFEASGYPEGIDEEHGMGFSLDYENNRMTTKFTCGVALLLSPFYAMGVLMAMLFSLPVDPFSRYFLIFISIGASFYVVNGLYFLKRWLDFYVNSSSSFLAMMLVFFGTHLYYYTMDENLMGHLYSFSLFSAALYSFKVFTRSKASGYFILFTIATAIAILIRPTNVFFLFIILFLDVKNMKDLESRIKLLLVPKFFITGIFLSLLIFLPQLLYWKFAFGRFLSWSYQGEGFYFWDEPRILITWFSPQSGLFPYTPMILLSLFFAFWMIKKKIKNGAMVLVIFLIVSYICASWSNPFFGDCNFGKRPFVEYLPILMLPVAYALQYFRQFSKAARVTLVILLSVFIVHNLGLFVVFHTCFDGGTWEWSRYVRYLEKMLLTG